MVVALKQTGPTRNYDTLPSQRKGSKMYGTKKKEDEGEKKKKSGGSSGTRKGQKGRGGAAGGQKLRESQRSQGNGMQAKTYRA